MFRCSAGGESSKNCLSMAKLGNICFGNKICVREAEMFLTRFRNILNSCFQDAKFATETMFLAWLNWETFASAAMLPSLARP